MLRRNALWATLSLAVAVTLGPLALGPAGGAGAGKPAPAEWTVLVFLNAKNNLEPFSFVNYKQMYQVGSTREVNILVEFGRPRRHQPPVGFQFQEGGQWSKTLRFRVEKDKKPMEANALEDLGKVDMGRGQALVDFVKWGREKYPAKRYALVIWDHGQGWRFNTAVTVPERLKPTIVNLKKRMRAKEKAAFDHRWDLPQLDEVVHGVVRYVSQDEDTGNHLFNRDIQDSLRSLLGKDKLDLIGYDACLMSMIETAYAMRDVARYMVASQELDPGDGWDYARWLAPLVKNPQMDARELSKLIVKSYEDHYQGGQDTTMAAVDLSQVERLAGSVSSLAGLLDKGVAAGQELKAVQAARQACSTYAPYYGFPYIDLGLLLEKLSTGPSAAPVKEQAQAARQALQGLVLASYAAPSRKTKDYESNGLSIYFPESQAAFLADPDHGGYLQSNTYYPVEFVSRLNWARFLQSYLGQVPK